MWLVVSPSASGPTSIGIFGLFGAEIAISDQLDKYAFPSLTIFVNLVLGFFPLCNSDGGFVIAVCILTRNTRSDGFTISVRFIPSSKFAIIRFFSVCIDLSTTPFPGMRSGCAVFFFTISAFAEEPMFCGNKCSLFVGFSFFGYSVYVTITR